MKQYAKFVGGTSSGDSVPKSWVSGPAAYDANPELSNNQLGGYRRRRRTGRRKSGRKSGRKMGRRATRRWR